MSIARTKNTDNSFVFIAFLLCLFFIAALFFAFPFSSRPDKKRMKNEFYEFLS